MKSFKDAVIEAINEYNRYRGPEAKVKLVKLGVNMKIESFKEYKPEIRVKYALKTCSKKEGT